MAQRSIFEFVTPATIPTQLAFPPVETARERRNRLERERNARKRVRDRSRRAIDARLAGQYDGQADRPGPLRLHTRFGNVSVLSAQENLFRRARQARTRAQEERFLSGNGQSVTYSPSSYDELGRILDRYYSRLVDGEWFILLFGGRGYTLTLENYES